MDGVQLWGLAKLVIAILSGLVGLWHFLKLEKNDDAAYHAGIAIMLTMISYNLLEG